MCSFGANQAGAANEDILEPSHCEITPETKELWYDLSHAYLSKKFCEPAAAFDNFFGDDRNLEDDAPGTYARWRNDIVWNESDRLAFHTELKARVRLPRISKRLKLIIAEEHDDTFDNPLSQNSSTTNDGASAISEEKNNPNSSSIGLQYDLHEAPTYKTSFNIGVKSDLPPRLHSYLRYRYTHPFGDRYVFRFTETLFWRDWQGFGETSRFDLERLVKPDTLVRGSFSKTFSEISRGLDLNANIGTFFKISAKAGFSIDFVTSAYTNPSTIITNYGVVSKYRRNFYRKWLFFEIIPEINWPRQEDDTYEGVNTLTLRLDIQFWES